MPPGYGRSSHGRSASPSASTLRRCWRATPVRATLRRSPTRDAQGRGGPLRPRDEATRAGIAALADTIDVTAVMAAWELALAALDWDGPPVWIHGDLDARNLLVRDGQITGVVDWGSVLRRRSGLRREGFVGRSRRGDATDLPRAARDRRRDVGARSRLGVVVGDDRTAALPAHLPGDRPGSLALARRGVGRLLDRPIHVQGTVRLATLADNRRDA